MSRDIAAGAAVLDRLRERITSGCYLGSWQPGERLPSIRTIAAAEGVDRKTAAAAYRHLQEEGRVEIHARSGVYLRPRPLAQPSDPLERLHRQWLTHAYEGARSLGLDTNAILRFVTAVAEVERLRLPVVECDTAQAEAIASELRARLGVRASPFLLEEVRPGDPVLREAPVIVTTPYHTGELALAATGLPIVEVTLSPAVLSQLRRKAAEREVLAVGATRAQVEKLRRAVSIGAPRELRDRVRWASADDRATIDAALASARVAFLWPGVSPEFEAALPPDVERVRPSESLSAESVGQVQVAILHAAIRKVRRGTTSAAPRVAAL